MFECDEETSTKVEQFLDDMQILKKFKGRKFLRDMIIYSVNYAKLYNSLPDFEQICRKVQKHNKEHTWYNVRRLSDYACNDFYKRNGNRSLATAPYTFLKKAVNYVVFNERGKI